MNRTHPIGRLILLPLLTTTILCITSAAVEATTTSDTTDNPQGLFIRNIAKILSTDLNNTVEDELGISVIEDLYSKLKYVAESQDFEKRVSKIAAKLGMKLNETFSVLYNIADVMSAYRTLDSQPLPSVIAPCYLDEESGSGNQKSRNYEAVQQVLLKATGSYQAIRLKKHLKHLYFLSSFDVASDLNLSSNNGGFGGGAPECNRHNQSLLWSLYTNYHRSEGRNVLLLLDHGGSLTKQQLRTVKELAQQLIEALSPSDRIGVVAIQTDTIEAATIPQEQCSASPPADSEFSDNTYYVPSQSSAQSDRLESFHMWPATERHRRGLQHWIGGLTPSAAGTNHSLGLQWSLQALLSALTVNDTATTVMVYVSRGLLASIADARPVLEIVARGVEDLRKAGHGLMINTVAVIDESKPILFETQFLRDVAEQNYSQYNVESFSEPVKGSLLTLNSSQSVGLTVARLLHSIQQSTFEPKFGPRLSLPRWDGVSQDISVSVTIPWSHSISIYGVLGADLYFADLVEDSAYFGCGVDYSYAFIVNMKGLTLAHRTYQLPLSIYEQPRFVDIRHLEKVPDFDAVRQRLLTEFRGSHILLTANNETVQYIWEQVMSWYVVCIVVHIDRSPPKHPYKVHWPQSSDNLNGNQFLHYRLDMLPPEKLCLHLNQVATLDAGTLFLSPSCFKSPFAHLQQQLSPPHNILAYLSDNTRLISNPGLREHVRDEVAALAIILDYLHAQHLNGARTRYVVRRYVAGEGALVMYPGSVLEGRFEPGKREWYRKARERMGDVVMTPPYLDAGGAGFIVTIARAMEHVVVGMDVTLGYVYKVILDAIPDCASPQQLLKCFLMDEHGYLIYHPQLLDPNGLGPLERLHLIHKESFVASDLLGQYQHSSFVQKRLCVRYTDGTLQRYYQLNASVSYAQAQAHHGGCTRYQVAAVARTNLFVGIVNASCDLPPVTFCPCSVVDRRCLNCNRMEQRECECPCECPLLGCGSYHTAGALPMCAPTPLPITFHRPSSFPAQARQLRQCLPSACELLTTYNTCLGVLGCEWCRYDVSGELLTRSFCTSLSTCWGGMIGARPPPFGQTLVRSPTVEIANNSGAGDEMMMMAASSDQTVSAAASPAASATALPPAHYSPAAHYSPVGPIVGAVIGMCLILVVLFFCQRSYAAAAAAAMQVTTPDTIDTSHHQTTATNATNIVASAGGCSGGNNVRMSDLNLHDVERVDRLRLLRPEEEEEDDQDDMRRDAQAVLSPYCVFTGYKRPAQQGTTGECSDHGYSTMTPHDHDSEHMSFAPYRPEAQEFTGLPLNSRNCIIAPVTVHRNMEATQM